MLTAAQIINRANQIAKTSAYIGQALDLLNVVLSDVCQMHDFALARGVFNFNFSPSLTATLFGSGPYPLPLDYLRTSGSSGATGATKSVWYLFPTPAFPQGQPIYMTPIDLAQFDLYPQFPSQTTPTLWATDMGGPVTQRIVLSTSATLAATTTIHTASSLGLVADLAAAGVGITPGTTIDTVTPYSSTKTGNTTANSAVISGIGSTTGLNSGYSVTGTNAFLLAPGQYTDTATILTVNSGTAITCSLPLASTATAASFAFAGADVLLSVAATQTQTQASVFFGIAPVAYVYPPPLAAYPVTCRYQRQMPDVTDVTQTPWFPVQGYLIDKLAAEMMRVSDDTRVLQQEQLAAKWMQQYGDLADDKTNRAQQVQLDARNYGGGTPYDRARNTKYQGW